MHTYDEMTVSVNGREVTDGDVERLRAELSAKVVEAREQDAKRDELLLPVGTPDDFDPRTQIVLARADNTAFAVISKKHPGQFPVQFVTRKERRALAAETRRRKRKEARRVEPSGPVPAEQ